MNEADKHSMFMAAALSGMLAHPTRYGSRYGSRPPDPENWHKTIAQDAREIADAMLAESRNATDEGADND